MAYTGYTVRALTVELTLLGTEELGEIWLADQKSVEQFQAWWNGKPVRGNPKGPFGDAVYSVPTNEERRTFLQLFDIHVSLDRLQNVKFVEKPHRYDTFDQIMACGAERAAQAKIEAISAGLKDGHDVAELISELTPVERALFLKRLSK